MKEVFYNKNSISSFFIESINDSIFVISKGNESPFEHLDILNKTISKIAKNKSLTVYFDFLLYSGNNENRFSATTYCSKLKRIDFINLNKLSIDEIPYCFKLIMDNFYSINQENCLLCSPLTDIEKNIVKQIA